jgi:ankyrin repeat protein
MIACEKGYADIVETLLTYNANTNIKNKDQYTALILAAENGSVQCIELLLQKEGLEVDADNKFGKTALMLACETAKLECVRILTDMKSEIHSDVDFCSGRGTVCVLYLLRSNGNHPNEEPFC